MPLKLSRGSEEGKRSFRGSRTTAWVCQPGEASSVRPSPPQSRTLRLCFHSAVSGKVWPGVPRGKSPQAFSAFKFTL